MRTFIIAEAGVNHNGSVETAKKLIDEAQNAGADAVKFQTFIAEQLVSATAQKADYQKINTESDETQLSMLKKLELSFDDFILLKEYCAQKKIKFLTTAFDFESLDFVINVLNTDVLKIPSGELTNYPYLKICAGSGREIIMSTGMATIEEISESIRILYSGGCGKLTLLHCSTEYPASKSHVNLTVMKKLKEQFGCDVGYSDHTQGHEVAFAAVALNAAVIEKHFTLDKNMPGPDHKASLDPAEMKYMIEGIRNIETALGDGVKKISEAEQRNKLAARKSIVAKTDIKKGEIFTSYNITVKRPGNGISPMKWESVFNKSAVKNFAKDELIEL